MENEADILKAIEQDHWMMETLRQHVPYISLIGGFARGLSALRYGMSYMDILSAAPFLTLISSTLMRNKQRRVWRRS